ncbi:MAG TPA: trypsin-like peptidase domain-containing protein [Candidatus Limnocylindrales bacterium]|jgi:serine protease Do|nr:trypsin-like peptidase domain-containing protein [Candidatus Limnocylindrales bacterium]
MSAIEELQSAVSTVAAKAGPSVVGIGSRQRGSGVVVGKGKVLTNAHNIRGDEVTVTFADGRSTRGRLAGIDVDGDLAVVDVDTAAAKPLEWGDGSAASPGTVVFGASATPGGGTRVTFGTVSAVARAFRGPGGRRIAGSVEHTAPLAPGSSGGPIVDAAGRLLGLNTNRLGEGFYLALPADGALRERVDALGKGESVTRPRLGVAVAPSRIARRLRASVGLPERDGLLVRGVEDGSLAAKAGIREGDLIVEAAGKAVTDADELFEALGAAGDSYEVKIVRGTEERTIAVGGGPATGEA